MKVKELIAELVVLNPEADMVFGYREQPHMRGVEPKILAGDEIVGWRTGTDDSGDYVALI